MFTTFIASIALFAGLAGLALGVYALYRTRQVRGEYQVLAQRALAVNASGADPRAVRDVAVLHYDALEEMSGARSFSLAMLNSHGDGVVVTSINGRTETRTYAKAVTRGEADHLLSPEEYRVIRSARLGNGIGATLPDPAPAGPAGPSADEPDEDAEALVTVVRGADVKESGDGDADTSPEGGGGTHGPPAPRPGK
ncbi:DUF4446 family protein [Nocardiopsis sp. SBT366]|uniref:DUF4446 family protein n=1 Tax=Nocardiopsis sp. SBT366 TaxID=1580529 RepID=UPI00066E5B13|nr:DUF4446 family protein [Nocardiopsis sp. SBT366]